MKEEITPVTKRYWIQKADHSDSFYINTYIGLWVVVFGVFFSQDHDPFVSSLSLWCHPFKLRLHEELKNTTSRTIEVCKTTFRDACNEIKFNVYYNLKKGELTLSIEKQWL